MTAVSNRVIFRIVGKPSVRGLREGLPVIQEFLRSIYTADLSVQTGAGERIGDLLLAAKIARKSTAKITCPTSRWCIEKQAPEAIRISSGT
jgi:hypothetical protein